MQCEICGQETGKPVRIVVDGSHLSVCEGCSNYGKLDNSRSFEKPKQTHKQESLFEMGSELAPNFGKIVRQAREKNGMTIEELGKKVFEKASVLHRIEAESIKPSPQLTSKLEKELGIKITEE